MVIWDEIFFADFTHHNLCDMTTLFRKRDTQVIQPFPMPTICNINGVQHGEIYRLLKRKECSNFCHFNLNSPKKNRDFIGRGNLT